MHTKPFAAVAAAAIAAILITGCSKGSDQSSSSTTTTTTESTPAAAASSSAAAESGSSSSSGSMKSVAGATGDASHGQQIFAANCASCHGAAGVGGGVGPSLKGEKTRKNTAQAIAWIKNPQPPMPKLYPATLNEKDVADVAAYVESL